jgi:hypothetical protein
MLNFLLEKHTPAEAIRIYGFCVACLLHGEHRVRGLLPKDTFYRLRKLSASAGVLSPDVLRAQLRRAICSESDQHLAAAQLEIIGLEISKVALSLKPPLPPSPPRVTAGHSQD